MIATILAAAASSVIAAVLTTIYVLWLAEGLRRARRLPVTLQVDTPADPTCNVTGSAPTMPENQAAETPADVDRTQHTQATGSATPSPAGAGSSAVTRYAMGQMIDCTTGEIKVSLTDDAPPTESPYAATLPASTVSSAPILTDADDLSGLSDADLIAKGREAISRWRQAASQYRTYAEVLERSLNDARQDAAQQRKRADKLQEMYLERTQQLLRAGTRIVIDYGPRKRGE